MTHDLDRLLLALVPTAEHGDPVAAVDRALTALSEHVVADAAAVPATPTTPAALAAEVACIDLVERVMRTGGTLPPVPELKIYVRARDRLKIPAVIKRIAA